MHKRNRTIEEKIDDCLDNTIKNLHSKFREELYQLLLNNRDIATNVAKSKKYIYSLYNFPDLGIHTNNYWLARGWNESESNFKSKQNNTRKKSPSPFSIEFWLSKINPNTNNYYTKTEADYKRNSQRPIRKEYWIEQGYSEEESINLALQQKDSNNKSGSLSSSSKDKDYYKSVSPRCKEYYMLRGFTEEESIKEVSKVQATFSLDICIEKHGFELGRQVWLDRQERWHKNYKKSNFSKISQRLFWEIFDRLEYVDNIFFAELGVDKTPDKSGKNNEYRLKLDRILLPDFIDISTNKIIEFDGTYWHGDVGRGNKMLEQTRDDILTSYGYEVLHINENDYNINKELVIDKCLNFLNK